nr:DUF6471 domain-containing protein [uncultured Sphingomonas sp.]
MDEADWDRLTKNMLRAEMMRRGVSYDALVVRLAAVGVEENTLNLRNKVARGRFSATFFTQCMVALGVDRLNFPSIDAIHHDLAGDNAAQALAKKGAAKGRA